MFHGCETADEIRRRLELLNAAWWAAFGGK
jgi:hypothetical protein